ncbi:MAG TPA: VWA domain-containing protein [Candidatus Coprenecus stercoripullorum]|nr:VWA domain-containing protein [Candidatus Coprenecus stercoripullorum]
MIYFAQPQYLLLLLLLPLVFVLYGIMRGVRKRRIKRLGQPDLVEDLAPTVSRRKGWVKISVFAAALLFFFIGMARPQIGASLKERQIKGAEIMIVLDVSNSMRAEDYSPNRLERAKFAISKLVDRLRDDRVGLIVFAGRSFVQLPITSDYVSAKIFLNSISTGSVPVQGTAIGDALRTALRSFTADSENSRAVILITDGENHEDDPVAAARDAADMGARVYCIGVGSPEGQPIPMDDGELLRGPDGNIVVTRLDENTLKQIAEAGNGMYVRAGDSEFGLNPIIEDIRSMDEKLYKSFVFEEFDEQYMYFFAIALFFLILEFCISDTRNRKTLFGRQARILALPLVLFLSLPVYGQQDRHEVRKGNRNFDKENYREAEIDYRRALVEDSLSTAARYNMGNTLYRMERFNEAALYYKDLGDTLKRLSASKASDFFHNSGNLSLKQKDYAGAVEAYKESLRLEPDNMETKSNLAYAQKLLEESQNQSRQGGRDKQDSQQDDRNRDDSQEQQQDNQDNHDNQDRQDNQDRSDGQQPAISPQAARQMLQAIEDKEKDTQEKVKKAKAEKEKTREKEKNW